MQVHRHARGIIGMGVWLLRVLIIEFVQFKFFVGIRIGFVAFVTVQFIRIGFWVEQWQQQSIDCERFGQVVRQRIGLGERFAKLVVIVRRIAY